MRTLVNVATPFTAFTCPPVSVPPPGLAPIVSVMTPVKLVTTAPASLRASTKTGGDMAAPTGVLVGCRGNTTCVGPGGGGGGGGGVDGARGGPAESGRGGGGGGGGGGGAGGGGGEAASPLP